MYSPEIQPDLVKKLYLIAQNQGVPMTKLVNDILEAHLNGVKPLEVRQVSSFESPVMDRAS